MQRGNTRIVALQNRAKTAFSKSIILENDYPDVLFWTRADWDKWQTTSQGLKTEGKARTCSFLEDENGEPITEESLDTIRKTIRGLWFETLFHSIMEEKHPLFRFAMDGWKLDLFQSKKVKEEDNDINYRRGTKRTCSPDFEGGSALKRVKVAESVNLLTTVKGTSALIVKANTRRHTTSAASSVASLAPVVSPIPPPDASLAPVVLPSVVTPIPPPSPTAEKENQPPTHGCIVLTNPLPTVPTNIPLAPGNPAALPQVNDAPATGTTSSSKKPAKMRPGPTKKGRKHVTPGSTNEFNAYYSTLNEAQIQVL
ncbi:hypothetical protein DFJ58DRAFT_795583 [Suillus subalutaceus]|uniref:uncharacterized protein n=1 Tax=Suillus subalutaceus TaxID=48586 RepID=UPI001B8858EE|nr:uncharacterized protein DFJ58DRAFT_795583 [Suillus subalutaceus]KAG1848950.1 hypothetical protein DFJ58DRAFT_795583 [Suillus subalutaceus]